MDGCRRARARRAPRSAGTALSRTAWAQDDWQISNSLTLNLGLRWDGALNAFANDIAVPPFQQAGRPQELDNIEPRVGFAWKLGERTVIRGGTGLYYGDALGADQLAPAGAGPEYLPGWRLTLSGLVVLMGLYYVLR